MLGLDALQSVRYVTVKGKRFAVLDVEDWEALIEWLETLEDLEIARQATATLQKAHGDRAQAGWLKWEEVRGELERSIRFMSCHERGRRSSGFREMCGNGSKGR